MKDLLLGRDRVARVIQEHRASRSPGRGHGGAGLNCLVLGGGGREYAIAWRLARSASVGMIDVVPGNGAMALFARVLDFPPTDIARIEQHCAAASIDLVIVGPDDLVASGIGDEIRRSGVTVVCPSVAAARIESSKAFAKALMAEAGVPTAASSAYPSAAAALAALDQQPDGPLVVKADGLAAGKGVVIAKDRAQARAALSHPPIAEGAVVLEELLAGPEASLMALVDGETVVALPPSRDHKRLGDGDTGPNTGGMGACSPTAVLPDEEAQPLADALIAPVARLLAARGTPYRGVIFAGLLQVADGWRVLEYNARFGDPEAQVVLPRLGGDFALLMTALGDGRLAEHVAAHPVRFSQRAYVDVALCASGYPASPRRGDRITVEDLPDDVWTFHAGTRRGPDGGFITDGGRVLHIVAQGDTVAEARRKAYLGAERVHFEGKFYRQDIAEDRLGVSS
jgi:phosphoribosylamine--glycine ligase